MFPSVNKISISIHAPARGATRFYHLFYRVPQISIHAPARGATRARCGVVFYIAISIHAPARGATAQYDLPMPDSKFQSTLPRGERRDSTTFSTVFLKFQSTLPRGERPKTSSMSSFIDSFQSTLPRGERPKHTADLTATRGISIHAPARGATSEQKGDAEK